MKKRCIIQDLDVAYTDIGTGSTILFLHGWGASAASFESLIEHLPSYRCVAISFPGFGGSERPPQPWGVMEYAQFLQNFLAKHAIEPDYVVAHSFGGRVVIKSLATELIRPKKLVLIAAAGVAKKSIRTRVLGVVAKVAKVLTSIPPLTLLREQLKRLVASRDYASAGAMRETFLKVINENLEQDAAQISIPTLLLWGEQDTQTPLSEARTLQACIQNTQLVVKPGAGHFIHEEYPDYVAKHIKDFL